MRPKSVTEADEAMPLKEKEKYDELQKSRGKTVYERRCLKSPYNQNPLRLSEPILTARIGPGNTGCFDHQHGDR